MRCHWQNYNAFLKLLVLSLLFTTHKVNLLKILLKNFIFSDIGYFSLYREFFFTLEWETMFFSLNNSISTLVSCANSHFLHIFILIISLRALCMFRCMSVNLNIDKLSKMLNFHLSNNCCMFFRTKACKKSLQVSSFKIRYFL